MGAKQPPLEAPAGPNRRAWIGYGLAAVSLIWVFHDVSLISLWAQIRAMRPGWIALAVAVDILAYMTQGWRWHRLLSAVGEVGPVAATKATYAGLYVNEVLPLRLGELLRIHLVARLIGGRYSPVLSSVIVERFFDAVWLAAAFGAVVILTPLPGFLVDAEELLAAIAFGALAVFVALAKLSERRIKRGRPPARNRFLQMFQPLGESLALIGRSKGFAPAFAASIGVLGFQAIAYYFVGLSYGLAISFWQCMGAFLVLHVGNVVPGAPGNLGTYQLFTVLGLTIFGVDKTSATGFSIVVFLILTIPLWAIGSYCFAESELSLKSVRQVLSQWTAGSGF